jgi:integrase/recombinase XerD
MAHPPVLGPLVRRFFLEEGGRESPLRSKTPRRSRATLRLRLPCLAARWAPEPPQVTGEPRTVDGIKPFLPSLAQARGHTLDTRTLRLTALPACFRFVSRQSPALSEHAPQLHHMPIRRTLQPTLTYLEKAESDAVRAPPDRTAFQGPRADALLLCLDNPGARAPAAAPTHVGALQLDSAPAAVRCLGKGRKVRLGPLWSHTVEV